MYTQNKKISKILLLLTMLIGLVNCDHHETSKTGLFLSVDMITDSTGDKKISLCLVATDTTIVFPLKESIKYHSLVLKVKKQNNEVVAMSTGTPAIDFVPICDTLLPQEKNCLTFSPNNRPLGWLSKNGRIYSPFDNNSISFQIEYRPRFFDNTEGCYWVGTVTSDWVSIK